MEVLGVDLSTKKVAFARVNKGTVAWLEVVAEGKTAGDRFLELVRKLVVAMTSAPEFFDVKACFIEDISFLRSRRNELDMAKVQGAVQALLDRIGIPTHNVNNMTVKAKWNLTRQGKEGTVRFIQEVFDVELPSHDVADAALTAMYGRSLLEGEGSERTPMAVDRRGRKPRRVRRTSNTG